MEQKPFNNVRVCFQRPDGLYPVEGVDGIHLLDEDQIMKLIVLGGEWLCVRWIDPYLGMDKNDHKLCEAVQKYLNDENDEEDVTSGQVHVTGAWVSNNRRKVQMIFGTADSSHVKRLSVRTLNKIINGGVLDEVDKQDIINSTNPGQS